MSDEIIPERLLTIPPEVETAEKEPVKQALVRLHQHDHKMLKVMLKKDKMSFQKFVLFCVRAYLDGDPFILKMLKNYRELEAVPRDVREKHVLSHRERESIYRELEAEMPEVKP